MKLKRWAIAPTTPGFIGEPLTRRYWTRFGARRVGKRCSGRKFGQPRFCAVKA